MRTVNPFSLIPSQSSGSSGCSITVRRSWFEERLHNAFRWRALLSSGLHPTYVHAYLMLARPPKTQENSLLHRVAQAIGLGRMIMSRMIMISCCKNLCCNLAFLGPTRHTVEQMHQVFLSQLKGPCGN